MPIVFYFSLGILILLFGIQVGSRFFKIDRNKFFRISRAIFFGSIVLVFILLFYYSRRQFFAWYDSGPPAQYLVPPFSGIGYFLFYVLARFWAAYFVSFSISLLFFYAAKALNEKYGERFFYPEEYCFLAISIFLTGHPAWILDLFLVCVIYILVSGFKTLILRQKERISFYFLWIPVAILVILLSRWPILQPLFQVLKF